MILKFMVTVTFMGYVMGSGHLWAVQLTTQHEEAAEEVAKDLGMVVVGRVFNDVFILREDGNEGDGENNSKGLNHPLITWSEKQVGHTRTSRSEKNTDTKNKDNRKEKLMRAKTKYREKKRVRRTSVVGRNGHFGRPSRNIGGLERRPLKSPWSFRRSRDPLRWRQWYLGAGSGMHLNVTGLWKAGIRGGGISVAVLDDGVELTHLDLALNYDPAASWDLLDSDPDPMPVSWSRHGTQLAGIIAATHFNGMCGMGVAPWSGVGAIRMLGYVVYDAVEAAALAYERDHVDVYVAAWGPVDTGAVMEGPGVLASRALRESIALGRKGLGSIYVWASGNGGYVGDDCNADGYSNSVYTITVSGSTQRGRAPNYAETCAATFVSTYSGDADEELDSEEQINGIVTTDLGGVCTESFRGSSVSAAMVGGACALALDVNPRIGWRDMQHLMVKAATPHNPLPSQWSTNGVGLMYSHYFGFGSLNAGKMADLARNWKNVPPSFRCYAHSPHQNITLVPDNTVIIPISLTGCQIVQAEHIQVNITLSSDNRGQIEIGLKSPSGTRSKLLPQRPLDLSPYGIYNHPLLSVHMWGEDPRGIWKIYVTYHSSSILEPFGEKLYVTTPNMLLTCTLIVHGTEIPIDVATIHDFHYNKTQLSRAMKKRNRRKLQSGNETTESEATSQELENPNFRIEVEHWITPSTSNGDTMLYLFCRVLTPLPDYVTNVEWLNSRNESFNDVIRRLKGQGHRAAKYPSLLIIRKTEDILGNFTCRVTYNSDIYTKTITISSNYSSIPESIDTVQVAAEGDDVSLPCESLSPILRGTWTKDGQRLQHTPRIAIDEDQLSITDVREEDAGVYECHKSSPRLHYYHKAVITLLMAKGPSTLINHYAIDSHPPIPTAKPQRPCSSSQNSSDLETEDPLSIPFSIDTLKIPQKQCPPPYRPIEGYCVLVGAGPARPWHQARQQCQRRSGDLLVVHDASLMLALIQLLHTQGLASKSFWVGGLREDVRTWRWVDGVPMPIGAPFWFLTPTNQPQEVPIIQRNDERSLDDFGSRREVFSPERGFFMQSTGPQTSHARSSLLRRLGIQESTYSTRRRQMRRRRRRSPQSRTRAQSHLRNNNGRSGFQGTEVSMDTPYGTPSSNSRSNPGSEGLSERLVLGGAIYQTASNNSRLDPLEPKPRTSSGRTRSTTGNLSRRSPTRPRKHRKREGSKGSLRPQTRSAQGTSSRPGRPRAPVGNNRGTHSRSQRPKVPANNLPQTGPRLPASTLHQTVPRVPSSNLPQEDNGRYARPTESEDVHTRPRRPVTPTKDHHPRDIYGQRAACMWAGLRHFFGSCSVLERLSALCEYKET